MTTARHVFYEGNVQGVGFRYTVKTIARGYDVVGRVCNLPDGRVEMQAGGDTEELDAFLQAIRESSLAGHIRTENATPIPALVGVRGFSITG